MNRKWGRHGQVDCKWIKASQLCVLQRTGKCLKNDFHCLVPYVRLYSFCRGDRICCFSFFLLCMTFVPDPPLYAVLSPSITKHKQSQLFHTTKKTMGASSPFIHTSLPPISSQYNNFTVLLNSNSNIQFSKTLLLHLHPQPQTQTPKTLFHINQPTNQPINHAPHQHPLLHPPPRPKVPRASRQSQERRHEHEVQAAEPSRSEMSE